MHFDIAHADTFIAQRDQLCRSLYPFVDAFTPVDYEERRTRLYLTADQQTGFGITGTGELISVFSLVRGRGNLLVAAAVARGGVHLSCLGDHLRQLYETGGFRVTFNAPWCDSMAPPGWNYERFGRPSYYEMRIPA